MLGLLWTATARAVHGGRRRAVEKIEESQREGDVEDGRRVIEVNAEQCLDPTDAIDDGVHVDEAPRRDAPLDAILGDVGTERGQEVAVVRAVVVDDRPKRALGEGVELLARAGPQQEPVRAADHPRRRSSHVGRGGP